MTTSSNEEWDEIMGPPPSQPTIATMLLESLASTAATHDDETEQQHQRNLSRMQPTSSSRRPWNNDNNNDDEASLPNRWSQYEHNISKEEKDAATAQAVYHAATALADRQNDGYNNTSSSDDDEYHHAIRATTSGGVGSGFVPHSSSDNGSVGSTSTPPSFLVDHEQIRQEALRMLEVADADRHYSVYKTVSGGYTATAKKATTARRSALAGINLSSSERNSTARKNLGHSFRSDPFGRKGSSSLDDSCSGTRMMTEMEYGNNSKGGGYNNSYEDDDDETNIVDVIAMERRSLASRGESISDNEGKTNQPNNANKNNSWSSRYSIDSTLLAMTGGTVSQSSVSNMRIHNDPYSTPNARILDQIDRENRSTNGSTTTAKVSNTILSFFRPSSWWYNRNSNDDAINKNNNSVLFVPLSSRQPNLIYMDIDGRSSSMPPDNPGSKSWTERVNRNKRFQSRILLAISVALIVFIVSFSTLKHRQNIAKESAADANSDPAPAPVSSSQESVTFYVTSDIPFQVEDDKRLETELQALSGQAQFVVHLGNVQVRGECPTERYNQVADLLVRSSPKTVFIVPGTQDWNECPDPDQAWTDWYNAFSFLNEKFNETSATSVFQSEVYYQQDSEENWAFVVDSGVLFIGVHEVGGEVLDMDEFTYRNNRNYRWVMSMINTHMDGLRAIVIFGNYKPGTKQNTNFFAPLSLDLATDDLVNIPVLYVHSANGGSNRTEGVHQPFKNVPNLLSFSPPIGSSNPPYRINVGFGTNPFIFG